MNNLVSRIDCEIEKRTILKHPFYRLWSEGKLTVDNLQGYSKEYFQLVKAVPGFIENTLSFIINDPLKETLDQQLKEEVEHIEPWIKFAQSLNVSRNQLINYTGNKKTHDAICDLNQLTRICLEEAAAAMYAYEKELPSISRTKIEGLRKFYSIKTNDATNYFKIHEEADVRHAAVWRNILQTLSQEKEETSFNAAVRSLESQNKLLDSVQEKYVTKVDCW